MTRQRTIAEAPAPEPRRVVLYAHPDRWTINAEFPPEERARMRESLLGFAHEWLKAKGRTRVAAPEGHTVEDTPEQKDAAARWSARGTKVTPELLAAALDCTLTGALWESPAFTRPESTLRFHRAWRITLDVIPGPRTAELEFLARRWHLIPRPR